MKKTMTALTAAVIAASSCAGTVCAGTTTYPLPEKIEALLADALGAEEYVYDLRWQLDGDKRFSDVTILTPTHSYALKGEYQGDTMQIRLDASVQYISFSIYSTKGCAESLRALTGNIGWLSVRIDPESYAGSDQTTSTMSDVYITPTDENGVPYPYEYVLTSAYSDASAEEKAAWAWDTYHALADMDGLMLRVYNMNYMEGEEIGSYPLEPVFGDANGNHQIDSKDSLAALKAAADLRIGLTPALSAERITLSDVDGDGTLTVKDAQYILIYYANTRIGYDCDWRTLTGNPDAPAESNLT